MAEVNDIQQRFQVELLKKSILSQILDGKAAERLGRIKVANPTFASQIENYLFTLYQTGKLNKQIDDITLRQLLEKLSDMQRNDIKIIRK